MSHSPTSTKHKKITMYATTWCGDCRLAKRWFDAHAIPYEYITIETDEQAAAEVLRINGGMRSVPTIVFSDGSVLVEPSVRELSAKCLQVPEPTLGERLKHFYQSVIQKAR
jgi:mycoredoxin